jgi:hypothetical protein
MRIPPGSDATSATVEQIRRLVGLLPKQGEMPLFVFVAGYDPIAIGHDLAGERIEVLCRIRDDRVFYTDPPPRPNRPAQSGGRPPRHGKRWKCSDPASWTTPSDSLVATDPRYGTVTVTAWHDVHPRLFVSRALVVLPDASDRQGQRDPSRSRAPAETDRPHKEDALAVVVRQR